MSYDLHQPGRNYAVLIAEIKKCPGWLPVLASQWLVATTENMEALNKRLLSVMDANDSLLIMKAMRPMTGWLSQAKWDWINKNVPAATGLFAS